MKILSYITLSLVLLGALYVHQGPRVVQIVPVAVYPSDGASIATETLLIYTDVPDRANFLYVKAHQPFYHLSAWTETSGDFNREAAVNISVNNGAFTPVNDANVTCASEEAKEECIAGGYATVRFALPVSNIVSGENTIRFRWNGSKGIRSGFRVLEIGLLEHATDMGHFNPFEEGIHDWTMLQWQHDPQQMAGVTQTDIDNGNNLWHNEPLVNNTIENAAIDATCSSCHVTSGADLQFFQYENDVVYARSRFHGLTHEEALDVVAYIRSLELQTDEGVTYDPPGTPWDPPFQPGPTALASRTFNEERTNGQPFVEMDEELWAAGAGLKWQTDSDAETMPYVFAKNPLSEDPTPTADRFPSGELNWHKVSLDGTLNMRLIPISAQFPDWNNWLPDIHPIDGQPDAYAQITDELAVFMAAGFPFEVDNAMDDLRQAFRNGGFRSVGAEAGIDKRRKMVRVSGYQWKAVKAFEKMQLGGYADTADDRFCDDPLKPWCEPLSWFGTTRNLFDIGPHISSKLDGLRFDVAPYSYGSLAMDEYFTHLWYQLQMTVNAHADPESAKQKPVDMEYQRVYMARSETEGGIRYFASIIKTMQVMSNGYGVDGDPDGSNPTALEMRRGFLAQTNNPDFLMRTRFTEGDLYGHLPDPMLKDLWMAGMRAYWDYISRFPASEFDRGTDSRSWKPETFVVDLDDPIRRQNAESNIYRGLFHSANFLGPRAYPLIDSIAVWGEAMYPNTAVGDPDWNDLAPGVN